MEIILITGLLLNIVLSFILGAGYAKRRYHRTIEKFLEGMNEGKVHATKEEISAVIKFIGYMNDNYKI